ncbi:L-threonylcarbamoyladenylate synthase [Ferrimicrobium sp.]|uniref:L-threonylcarbamoyladenylate synthase n=1 Tax=Ferrimicrobium sp. TaxID=2926050 RepID=UPI002637D9A2|nr:L-threonylcarbamoyladenylate synthase [Ferrimicrobium sp.]
MSEPLSMVVYDLRTGHVWERDEAAAIEWARSELRDGRCVIAPTDTVFGLLADARNPLAVAHIAHIKGRTSATPPPVLIDSVAMAERLATPPMRQPLLRIADLWPGPLSVIVDIEDPLGRSVNPVLGTAALRVPAVPWLRALCRDLPLAASSANRHGIATATRVEEVIESLCSGAHFSYLTLAIDYGTVGSTGSTVIDMTRQPPTVVRQGALAYDVIAKRLPGLRAAP